MGPRVLVAKVVHVAGRHEREARLLGCLDEEGRQAGLHLEARVLHLDVDLVASEDLRQPVELADGVVGLPCSSALQTRPERHPDNTTSPAECASRSSQSTRGL